MCLLLFSIDYLCYLYNIPSFIHLKNQRVQLAVTPVQNKSNDQPLTIASQLYLFLFQFNIFGRIDEIKKTRDSIRILATDCKAITFDLPYIYA